MSANILRLIPSDTTYVPTVEAQEAASRLLDSFFPEGEECKAETYVSVTFFDQGENLEFIICPACARKLKVDYFTESDPIRNWWMEVSEPVVDACGCVEGVEVRMPCCGAVVPFTSLRFDWPAGCARFELSMWDPEPCEKLSGEQFAALERALGCQLIEIWCHC